MNGYCVLIVDDDQSVHDVLGVYLGASGIRVVGCRDGADAVASARDCCPDLVLLDVQMPVVHGFDALRLLRADDELRSIPVIFLSSLTRTDFTVRGLEMGAEDFIAKPFKKPELLARINAALRRSHRYTRTNGIVEGELETLGLPTLLQTLELGRKTGVLRMPGMDAEVGFWMGGLTSVRFGRFKGAQALARAVFVDAGMFSIELSSPAGGAEAEPATLMGALLDAARSVDETKRLGGELLVENPVLTRVGGIADYRRLAAVRDALPATVVDLMLRMPGALEDNVCELRRAYDSGALRTYAGVSPQLERV